MANFNTGPRPRYNDGVTDPRELVMTTSVWNAIPKEDRKKLRKAMIYWENVERRELSTLLDKLAAFAESLDEGEDKQHVLTAHDLILKGGEMYISQQEELNKDRGAKIREAAAERRANALDFGEEVNPLEYLPKGDGEDDEDDDHFDPADELEEDVEEIVKSGF